MRDQWHGRDPPTTAYYHWSEKLLSWRFLEDIILTFFFLVRRSSNKVHMYCGWSLICKENFSPEVGVPWWQVGPLKGISSIKGTFDLESQKSGPFFTLKVPFPKLWSLFKNFHFRNKIIYKIYHTSLTLCRYSVCNDNDVLLLNLLYLSASWSDLISLIWDCFIWNYWNFSPTMGND